MTSFKDFFKPSDFMFDRHSPGTWEEDAAWIANVRLKTYIESCPVVYASKVQEWQWTEQKDLVDTHQAWLAFIEELPKEPCKHEPTVDFYGTHLTSKPRCKHCGVELQATWSEKK